MSSGKARNFDIEKRKKLAFLLKEGFNIKTIAESINVSRQSIYRELKKGLTSEEYEYGRHIKYSPKRAIESDVKQFIGKESLELLKEYYKEN